MLFKRFIFAFLFLSCVFSQNTAARTHVSGNAFQRPPEYHISGNRASRPPSQKFIKPKRTIHYPKKPLPKTFKDVLAKARRAWRKFQAKNGKHWVIVWNVRIGIPYKIMSNTTHKFEGNTVEAGMLFLRENDDLFSLPKDLSNLVVKKQGSIASSKPKSGDAEKGGVGESVTFSQKYRDIDVFNSEITIYFDSEKRVFKVESSLYPITMSTKINNLEDITQVQAKKNALKVFTKKYGSSDAKVVRTGKKMYPTKEAMYKVWMVIIKNKDVKFSFLVDTEKGRVLRRENITSK